MTKTTEQIQNDLRENVDLHASVLAVDGDTDGVVLWQRINGNEIEYIVHRWATTYFDGSPLVTIMFYSGYYTLNEQDARNEFRSR